MSVVLPTIGRPELIRACLESLARCDPAPDEILVVDSSADGAVQEVVSAFEWTGARRLQCGADGVGMAFNLGLREARNEIVLLTNDDCTVDSSWVGHGMRDCCRGGGDVIIAGRVRPRGDPDVVPSTIDDPIPHEYAGKTDFVLYTQCMAVRRSAVLEFGGFDDRIRPSAEDNDLSYRWLRTGRRIRYQPGFVVWHHDWRTREQLERLYIDYGIGKGMVYGLHLRRGDLMISRHLLIDLYAIARGVAARLILGHRDRIDARLGLLRGLPVGLARGWRSSRGSAPSSRS